MRNKLIRFALSSVVSLSVMISSMPAAAFAVTETGKTADDGHIHEHDHSHGDCSEEHEKLLSGDGINVAVLDAGITDYETVKSISFVDDAVFSDHGNQMAQILLNEVPDVSVFDVRILDSEGKGTYSDVSKAIEWSVANDADVIVMSFEGYEASSILEKAVDYAEENGVLLIAAAGNDSSEDAVYPAAYPTVISAGLLNEEGNISAVSNYGASVDVYVVGAGGTSYAAQYVAADAVRYMQENPDSSCAEIRRILTDNKIKSYNSVSGEVDSAVYAAACSHIFNGSYTVTKAATCTSTGTKIGKCTRCSAVVSTVTIPALNHSWSSWSTTKSATCTSTGSQKRTCSRCRATETNTIPVKGHSFNGSYTTTKAATCTEAGTKVGKCSVCSTVVSTGSIPALGHSLSTSIKDATCTTNGSKTTKCSRCSYSSTSSIPATGHTFNGSYETTKPATCTTDGTKVGKCTKCAEIVSTATIEALGHDWSDWSTTESATCTEEGTKKRTCSRCKTDETGTIPETGHTFNGSYETTKPATCTTDGTKVGKCTKCAAVLSTATIKAPGHDWGDWNTTKSATCTEEGTKKRTCSRCKTVETGTIPETGHTFNGSFETTKPATCTEDGTKVGKCIKCAAVLSTATIKSPGHDWGDWIITFPVGCEVPGEEQRKCTVCDEKENRIIKPTDHNFIKDSAYSDPATCREMGFDFYFCIYCKCNKKVPVPPTDHEFTPWEITDEPTCLKKGSKVRKCKFCGIPQKMEMPELSHTFNGSYSTPLSATCTENGLKEGKCTKCGTVVSSAVIPATGHDLSSYTLTPATCTTNGTMVTECENCTYRKLTSTPKKGHKFNGTFETTRPATCTVIGEKVGKCTECGDIVTKASVPKINHKFSEWELVEDSTCTESGSKIRKCTNTHCTHSETAIIPPKSHRFNGSFETTIPATCTANGEKVGKCLNCGEILNTSKTPPKGHKFGKWIIINDSTCTMTGAKIRLCTNDDCNCKETGIVPPKSHRFNGVFEIVRPAGCTEYGIQVGKCLNCDEVLNTSKVPPTGHKFGPWETVTESTCTESGSRMRKCTNIYCTHTEEAEIPPKAHRFNGSFETTVSATCTENGEKVAKCLNCGDVINTATITAYGHNYRWTVTTPATCTSQGEMVKQCTRCGDVAETKTTPILAHSFNGSFNIKKEATCEASGIKEARCTKCGELLASAVIPAGHIIRTTEVPATCTTDGTITESCIRCPYSLTQKSTNKTGHSFNGSFDYKAPTATEDGYRIGRCLNCGDELIHIVEKSTGCDVKYAPNGGSWTPNDTTATYTTGGLSYYVTKIVYLPPTEARLYYSLVGDDLYRDIRDRLIEMSLEAAIRYCAQQYEMDEDMAELVVESVRDLPDLTDYELGKIAEAGGMQSDGTFANGIMITNSTTYINNRYNNIFAPPDTMDTIIIKKEYASWDDSYMYGPDGKCGSFNTTDKEPQWTPF
ncbi:MAG: hypothetical protein J6L05_06520 [Ruminococcus sp.]|nr:hypothetical protein [Ruminococcus sp.]